MKNFSKLTVLLTAVLLAFSFIGCEQSTSNDGNTVTKLEAPTDLAINSITVGITTQVNCTFTYNGKLGLDGASAAILGYSTTNDSSKAIYDTYNSTATVEAGTNTRTVQYTNFIPAAGKKYYFWIKTTNPAYSISDSAWSNVAEFTYN